MSLAGRSTLPPLHCRHCIKVMRYDWRLNRLNHVEEHVMFYALWYPVLCSTKAMKLNQISLPSNRISKERCIEWHWQYWKISPQSNCRWMECTSTSRWNFKKSQATYCWLCKTKRIKLNNRKDFLLPNNLGDYLGQDEKKVSTIYVVNTLIPRLGSK